MDASRVELEVCRCLLSKELINGARSPFASPMISSTPSNAFARKKREPSKLLDSLPRDLKTDLISLNQVPLFGLLFSRFLSSPLCLQGDNLVLKRLDEGF